METRLQQDPATLVTTAAQLHDLNRSSANLLLGGFSSACPNGHQSKKYN